MSPHEGDLSSTLAAITRTLATGRADALVDAIALLALGVPEASFYVRAADAGRSLLAASGNGAGTYRLDVPLRSAQTVVGTLTALSAAPLAVAAQRLLPVVADVLSITLHLAHARDAYARSLLDSEADRAEVAGELHEGLTQTLVAARHAVAMDAPATTVSAVLARAMREGRRTVGLLRPRAVDGDLAKALRGLAGDLTAAGSAITVDAPTLPALPPAIATLAYRVVTATMREEIGAIRVQVRLAGAERLIVTVTGMVDAMDAGVAARWRRRVLAAGGELEIGVDRVEVALPLPSDTTAALAPVATLGKRR